MKNSLIILMLLPILILSSCNMGRENFNRQKFTTLKQTNHSNSNNNNDAVDLLNRNQALYSTEIENMLNQASFNEGTPKNKAIIQTDTLISDKKTIATNSKKARIKKAFMNSFNKDEIYILPKKNHKNTGDITENEEWQKARNKGFITGSISLTILLACLAIVIALGGINTAIFLLMLLGISFLITALAFYTKASKLRQTKPWNKKRSTGFLLLGLAGILVGLGLVLAVILWSTPVLLICIALAILTILIASFLFIKAQKEKYTTN